MFSKKYHNLLFILIMGFGMSLLMTLIITFINTGMDNKYIDRFLDNPSKIKEQVEKVQIVLNKLKTKKSSSELASLSLNKFL